MSRYARILGNVIHHLCLLQSIVDWPSGCVYIAHQRHQGVRVVPGGVGNRLPLLCQGQTEEFYYRTPHIRLVHTEQWQRQRQLYFVSFMK